MTYKTWMAGLLAVLFSAPALAYIGPGAGISFLGSFFSTLMVILLAISAVLFWPLRYMWRRLRRLSREARQARLAKKAAASGQNTRVDSMAADSIDDSMDIGQKPD